MTGFKSGASDDDPLGSGDTEAETTDTSDVTEDQSSALASTELDSKAHQETTASSTSDLPWIFARSSITDGREKTVQLHLQESTLDAQRQTKSDVESELGETVKKADLREAAIIIGLQQIDEVTDILEEWGYGR